MSDKLPRGWAAAAIKDVLKLVNGYAFKPSQWEKQGLPIIRIQNLNDPSASYNYCSQALPVKVKVKAGDVLFAWSGTPGTSFGAHVWKGSDAWLNQHIFRVEFNPELFDKHFLQHAVNQNLDDYIAEAHGGAGLAHITKGKFEAFHIKIAPVNEQRRIVDKLEKILAKVNASQKRLGRIPVLLKRFRQSVLAAACSGRLTADWRAEHSSVVSLPFLTSNTNPPEDLENVFERSSSKVIPDTWKWVRVCALGELAGGGTPSKANPELWSGNIPWVSPKDMKRDRIVDSEDHVCARAFQVSPIKLIPRHSVLFVVRGMILNHTLPVALTEREVTLNQDMKALVLTQPDMAEYVFLAAKSAAKEILFSVKEATHGTRRIESVTLKNWAIPIPPVEEQKVIVKRVEELFSFAGQIEARYVKAKAHVDKLTQSVLAKAFRGELVPQDPNDEPASVLLGRIRAANA